MVPVEVLKNEFPDANISIVLVGVKVILFVPLTENSPSPVSIVT
jgi:hypothetical protein